MALTTILEEQTLTFTEDSGLWISTLNMYVPFTTGEIYRVIWDGTEYEMTAVEITASGLTLPVIGNTSLLEIDDAVDTGEPFCIYHMPSEYAGTETGLLFIFASDTSTTHTVAIYQGTEESGGEGEGDGGTGEDNGTEEEQEGIVLKDRNGNDVAYYGIETLTLDTTTEGKQQKYTKGVKAEKTVELSLADGDQTVEPDEGTLLSRVTIAKPETLVPANIRNGVEVAGETGEFIGDTEELVVDLAMADGNQVIVPSADGKVISKVTIVKPDTLVSENVADGVDIAGIIGTLAAGGSDVNIEIVSSSFSSSAQTVAHNLGVVPDMIICVPSSTSSGATVARYQFAFGINAALAAKFPTLPAMCAIRASNAWTVYRSSTPMENMTYSTYGLYNVTDKSFMLASNCVSFTVILISGLV